MATLRDIRTRIKGVKSTAKITSAMKMVSTAKLKRAQNAIESARPYFKGMEKMLSNLVAAIGSDYRHPLLRQSEEVTNIALIVIGSDRGLCGSFNSNLLKAALNYLKSELPTQYGNANIKVISVGRKAVSFFKKQKFEIISEFPNIFGKLEFSTARNIVEAIKDDFETGKIDKVLVYRNEFINVMKQEPKLINLLPIESKDAKGTKSNINTDYIFEPEKAAIMNELLPKILDMKVWRSLLESNAAEQAARRVAMDNATKNANDLIKFLELQYNKARQASITKEMLEIVGGADALKSA